MLIMLVHLFNPIIPIVMPLYSMVLLLVLESFLNSIISDRAVEVQHIDGPDSERLT